MNDVLVRVLVPKDKETNKESNAASPSNQYPHDLPPGYEVELEQLPGIFSLKALKHSLCKRHYWNADQFRFIVRRTVEEKPADRLLQKLKDSAKQGTSSPLADSKGGPSKPTTKIEYSWLQNEEMCLMELDLKEPTVLFLERRLSDDSWPTTLYKPNAKKSKTKQSTSQNSTSSASRPEFFGTALDKNAFDQWDWQSQDVSGATPSEESGGFGFDEDEQMRTALMLSSMEAREDEEKESTFESLMLSKGFIIKKISDDGNCLFGAVADQVYNNPALHAELRKQCLDYMERDRNHFSQFVDEDFGDYILRKRCLGVYGNNPEIQALSELLARPVEVYSYSTEPMQLFQGDYSAGDVKPIRISYHRGNHYNSLRRIEETTYQATDGQNTPAIIPMTAEPFISAHSDANICFLCGKQCSDYEDLQIHMFTTCEKKDLL